MHKLILGDNQAIFRAGIAKVLASEEDFRVVAQCGDLARMILAIETYHSSVVVFTSSLEPNTVDLMRRVRAAGSRAVVIVGDGETASSYTSYGVRGVVYRDTTGNALVNCIRKVINGLTCVQRPANGLPAKDEDPVGVRVRERLTRRQVQIVGLIAQGCKNKDIAQRLGTTEQVIKNYLRSVYDKTGVSDRLELALFTIHHKALATAATEAVKDFPSPIVFKAIDPAAVLGLQPA
jgi:DNA-binding NarL/FixJ family response regulator